MGIVVRRILAFAFFLYGTAATAALLHCAIVALMHKNKRTAWHLFGSSVTCAIIFAIIAFVLLPTMHM